MFNFEADVNVNRMLKVSVDINITGERLLIGDIFVASSAFLSLSACNFSSPRFGYLLYSGHPHPTEEYCLNYWPRSLLF